MSTCGTGIKEGKLFINYTHEERALHKISGGEVELEVC